MEQLSDSLRRFTLSAEDVALINPNTRTAPVFRTNADAELTKKIYRRVPLLLNEKTNSLQHNKHILANENGWNISFLRMFDMTNDSKIFISKPHPSYTPLYEGNMIYFYDHRYATFSKDENDYIVNKEKGPYIEANTHQFAPISEMEERLSRRNWRKKWLYGIRRVSNNTNERTIICSFTPFTAVSYGLYLTFSECNALQNAALFSVFNSLTLDYIARNKINQPSITQGALYQLPVLPPETFGEKELAFIVPRVLELVYTAYDIQAFAQDVWAEANVDLRGQIIEQRRANHRATQQYADDSIANGVKHLNLFQNDAPPPFIWDEQRRAVLRAELDALIAKLYGLTRDELRYILDPQDVYGEDFPGETFRVLKEKEIKQYGEYRTRRLVLAAWDRLAGWRQGEGVRE
jgi:hypothetical protein